MVLVADPQLRALMTERCGVLKGAPPSGAGGLMEDCDRPRVSLLPTMFWKLPVVKNLGEHIIFASVDSALWGPIRASTLSHSIHGVSRKLCLNVRSLRAKG